MKATFLFTICLLHLAVAFDYTSAEDPKSLIESGTAVHQKTVVFNDADVQRRVGRFSASIVAKMISNFRKTATAAVRENPATAKQACVILRETAAKLEGLTQSKHGRATNRFIRIIIIIILWCDWIIIIIFRRFDAAA